MIPAGHPDYARRRWTDWLKYQFRLATDRAFQDQDARARQHGWTVEVRQGGLSRRYRDPRFDSLASRRATTTASHDQATHWMRPPVGHDEREVKTVVSVLLLIAAALVALPALGQFLRIVLGLLARLVAAAFLIALAIIVLVALMMHGVLV